MAGLQAEMRAKHRKVSHSLYVPDPQKICVQGIAGSVVSRLRPLPHGCPVNFGKQSHNEQTTTSEPILECGLYPLCPGQTLQPLAINSSPCTPFLAQANPYTVRADTRK